MPVSDAPYRIGHKDLGLYAGTRLAASAARRCYARDFVRAADPLLRAMLQALKDEPAASGVLLEGLRAVLAVEGRESSLPVAPVLGEASLRGELARQAVATGDALVVMAEEAASEPAALSEAQLAALDVRSPCEGHVWTKPVAALLMGPKGGPRLMQLYNEWLHQFVLLRDLLLAFVNWTEVPLPLDRLGAAGLRASEATRKVLLAALLTGRVRHEILIHHALSVWGGSGNAAVWGFQTQVGLALPAVFSLEGSAGLLVWHPAVLVASGEVTVFHYAEDSYSDAPRVEPGSGSAQRPATARASGARLVAVSEAGRTLVRLELELAGRRFAIDAGRIARAARYAQASVETTDTDPRAAFPVVWHAAEDLLNASGFVSAAQGVHACAADSLVTLGLLGVIYPENVIVAQEEPLGALRRCGKGYGALFLIGEPA